MSSKKQTPLDRLEEFSYRLDSLNDIIKLCAFAAEARRTLSDIQMLADVSPDFEEIIQKRIDASAEWTVHDDVVGVVLKSVSHKIDQLKEQLVQEV